MNIATLRIAYQGSSGSNYSTATVNVNDAATLVTGTAELAHVAGGAGAANTMGTLSVNGGSLIANNIFSGGGVASLSANGGLLVITNTVGTAMNGLSTLNLTEAQLRLQLNAAFSITNIVTTNLNASGITSFNVDSLANATGTNRFPLIKYSALTGSIANFTVGDLPPGLVGSLSNNAANQTIDLILSPLIVRPPAITAVTYSPINTTLSLSGTNGSPGLPYSVLASSDITLPLTNWSLAGSDVFDANGNFTFTIDINPNQSRRFYVLQSP
jgi:hypothetical protein